jgi:plastocyanin
MLLGPALAAATLLAACGAGSPTPPPATAQPPTAAPRTAAPVTAAPPTPVGGQEAPEVVITARNIAFEPAEATIAAGVAFRLGLDNRDAGVPHNLVLKDASGAALAKSEIISGPAQAVIELPPLTAGSYTYVCEVHPNMVGTLTAE